VRQVPGFAAEAGSPAVASPTRVWPRRSTNKQVDNASAVLGHLRRCSDQDHVSAARTAYSNDTMVSPATIMGPPRAGFCHEYGTTRLSVIGPPGVSRRGG
jgi:hypothetical protein